MAEAGKGADPKFTRAMVALLRFTTAFARRGGDVEAVLHKNRIPIGALSTPTMLVEANACYSAMEDMAEFLGDPFFGAMLAIESANIGSPVMLDAAANALTFGDFLCRFIVEVESQVDNVEHRVEVSSRAANFMLRRKMMPRGATTQVTAVNITFFVTLFKRGLGDVFDPAGITVFAPTYEGVPANFLPSRSLVKSRLNGVRIVFPPTGFGRRFPSTGKWTSRKGERPMAGWTRTFLNTSARSLRPTSMRETLRWSTSPRSSDCTPVAHSAFCRQTAYPIDRSRRTRGEVSR